MKRKVLQQIAIQIKKLRNERGLTQSDLASLAKIRPATLSDIENEKSNLEVNTLVSIASALDCELNIVFESSLNSNQ